MEKVIKDNTIFFYDDKGEKLMHIDYSSDECIWYFYSDKVIKVTENMELYNLLDDLFQENYKFQGYPLIDYKDDKKLCWYSDCYYDPDNLWQVASVSCLNIEREENYFKIWCSKKLDEMIERKDKTYGICFSPLGNGKYNRNTKTGLTFQDDFVIKIYQKLLNKDKTLNLNKK